MPTQLSSLAEKNAEKAQNLICFGGFNLLHIKNEIKDLLSLIGRDGFFAQYSKHDISHIDAMLEMLTDFIIPIKTQAIMTSGDWLMIVLSVYVHDLGMLVTKSEFDNRHLTLYPIFKAEILSGEQGKNYEQRIELLNAIDKEKFLYEEFVRKNHASRVRNWIDGTNNKELGCAIDVLSTLSEILAPLGEQFRSDVGLVAESHHLDDLDKFEKYLTSKPYGMKKDSEVNIHYAAILLRTADLLHITSDRTPSIMFKVIAPTDPLSQEEWAKQRAVSSIRAQIGKDPDGKDSLTAPRDTVEVFAHFKKEDGFFGLSTYLDYASRQLKMANQWTQLARSERGSVYEFPWSQIDQSRITTENFLKEKLSFEIDTYRVLELLTGHTLYNDTGVVLRELAQNAIDAVRFVFKGKTREEIRAVGHVRIIWNSKDRILTVTDNGSGMTEAIIKNTS